MLEVAVYLEADIFVCSVCAAGTGCTIAFRVTAGDVLKLKIRFEVKVTKQFTDEGVSH